MINHYGPVWMLANNFPVADYWETRYQRGGNSGAGSYGRLAQFKAEIINGFIKEYNIASLIEFGCGDGNQLSLMLDVPYTGVDISPTAITLCKQRFANDSQKIFMTTEEFLSSPSVADATMSLDVIYHLVKDEIYHDYMETLFNHAKRYCLVYSANTEEVTHSPHVRKRQFTNWIKKNASGWKLINHIPNKYPMLPGADPQNCSFADFYLFENSNVT